jgi:hypothetical protein
MMVRIESWVRDENYAGALLLGASVAHWCNLNELPQDDQIQEGDGETSIEIKGVLLRSI